MRVAYPPLDSLFSCSRHWRRLPGFFPPIKDTGSDVRLLHFSRQKRHWFRRAASTFFPAKVTSPLHTVLLYWEIVYSYPTLESKGMLFVQSNFALFDTAWKRTESKRGTRETRRWRSCRATTKRRRMGKKRITVFSFFFFFFNSCLSSWHFHPRHR